uniref:Adenosine kinase n=1 Tax=Setaria digitata TaxID=48799 RepID=A0A915PHD7_9BILA
MNDNVFFSIAGIYRTIHGKDLKMPFTERISKCREGIILGCGNPLLDIRADVSNEFLKKWNLKENDAIIADDQRIHMFRELVENYDVSYTPGGATLNSLRVCQWILNEPNRATFFGCIGDDYYGNILKQKTQEASLNACFQVRKDEKTGTCAALIINEHRSLCAHLAAANLFTVDHLEDARNYDLIEKAQYFYISGFFLTVCPAAVISIARHASERNKVFATNLAAPFIPKHYRNEFLSILPYVDILFGNENEAETFADVNNYNINDLGKICKKIAASPKVNKKRQRIIIFTQGSDPTIVFQDGTGIVEYPVTKLKHEEIVDTNGAGDAFVGGFLSQYIQNKSVTESIECGHYAAATIIRQEGCTFPTSCLYH